MKKLVKIINLFHHPHHQKVYGDVPNESWHEWFDPCLKIVHPIMQVNNPDGKVHLSLISLCPGLDLSFEFNVDKTNSVSVFGLEKQL